MAQANLLTRILQIGDEGRDVYGTKRAIIRHLKLGLLAELESKPTAVQNRMQTEWGPRIRKVQQTLGLPLDGRVGPATERGLRKAHSFDAAADVALQAYRDEYLRPALVFPIAKGSKVVVCQGIHLTAGLPGNYALDFCCKGGSPVVAPFRGSIVKISGRDPSQGADQNVGIFGYNVHLWTPDNVYKLFTTHYGSVVVREGQGVRPGDLIGYVGHWPGDPGRSHLHAGLTSAYGKADAIAKIEQIAHAKRWEAP